MLIYSERYILSNIYKKEDKIHMVSYFGEVDKKGVECYTFGENTQ